MKPKTPLLLMFNKFLFILFKYFENNLVLPVVYRVKLYPFCRHFISLYLSLSLMHLNHLVDDESVHFIKNVHGQFVL